MSKATSPDCVWVVLEGVSGEIISEARSLPYRRGRMLAPGRRTAVISVPVKDLEQLAEVLATRPASLYLAHFPAVNHTGERTIEGAAFAGQRQAWAGAPGGKQPLGAWPEELC